METKRQTTPFPLTLETPLFPEIKAKTNLMEMTREELGLVVRNFFKILDEIEKRNLN